MMKPMNRNVVIEPDKKEEVTSSGIYVPKSDDAVTSGIVRAIGKDVHDVVVGDHVVFKEYAPERITLDKVEHFLLNIEDILGVYEG